MAIRALETERHRSIGDRPCTACCPVCSHSTPGPRPRDLPPRSLSEQSTAADADPFVRWARTSASWADSPQPIAPVDVHRPVAGSSGRRPTLGMANREAVAARRVRLPGDVSSGSIAAGEGVGEVAGVSKATGSGSTPAEPECTDVTRWPAAGRWRIAPTATATTAAAPAKATEFGHRWPPRGRAPEAHARLGRRPDGGVDRTAGRGRKVLRAIVQPRGKDDVGVSRCAHADRISAGSRMLSTAIAARRERVAWWSRDFTVPTGTPTTRRSRRPAGRRSDGARTPRGARG